MSPGGGAAPMKPFVPPSLRQWNAGPGRSPEAAPVSSEVTSAGRSTSTQCQKPEGVGASGSKQVTTKLLVSSGKPDQLSWGDMFPFSATWSSPSGCPSWTSVLVTVKEGTCGRKSYGFGAALRSRLMQYLLLWACCDPSPQAGRRPGSSRT